MMIMEPKKAIAAIMSRRRSNMGEDKGQAMMKNESVKDEDGEMDPRHVAAQDIMAALESKSPHHLMEALSNFHELHKMHAESVPSEDLEA